MTFQKYTTSCIYIILNINDTDIYKHTFNTLDILCFYIYLYICLNSLVDQKFPMTARAGVTQPLVRGPVPDHGSFGQASENLVISIQLFQIKVLKNNVFQNPIIID